MDNNLQYAKSKHISVNKSFFLFPNETEFENFILGLNAKQRKGYVKKCRTEFANQKIILDKQIQDLTTKFDSYIELKKYEQKYQLLLSGIFELHALYLRTKLDDHPKNVLQKDFQLGKEIAKENEDVDLLTQHLISFYQSINFLFNDLKQSLSVQHPFASNMQMAQADDNATMLEIYREYKLLESKNQELKDRWKTWSLDLPPKDVKSKFINLFPLFETIYTKFKDNNYHKKENIFVKSFLIDKFTTWDELEKDLEKRGLMEQFNQVNAYIDEFNAKNFNLNSEVDSLRNWVTKVENEQYQANYTELSAQIEFLYKAAKEIEGKNEVEEVLPQKEDKTLAKNLLTFYNVLKTAWTEFNNASDGSSSFAVGMSDATQINPVEVLRKLFDECAALEQEKVNYESIIAGKTFKAKEKEQKKYFKALKLLFDMIKQMSDLQTNIDRTEDGLDEHENELVDLEDESEVIS